MPEGSSSRARWSPIAFTNHQHQMPMAELSLLPVDCSEWASVEHGYWYTDSPEFMQIDVMNTFRWLRVIGDTVFGTVAVALAAP